MAYTYILYNNNQSNHMLKHYNLSGFTPPTLNLCYIMLTPTYATALQPAILILDLIGLSTTIWYYPPHIITQPYHTLNQANI